MSQNQELFFYAHKGSDMIKKKQRNLQNENHLIFICGHYEGYDERIREHIVTDEISIGDFVLTGGELGAWLSSTVSFVCFQVSLAMNNPI